MTKSNAVARRLAAYLKGTGPLPETGISSEELTVALGELLSDRKLDQDEIAARVRSIQRGRKAWFQEPRLVTKALKLRRDGETLAGALQHVRQSRIMRRLRRRRR